MNNSLESLKIWGKENKIVAGLIIFILGEMILYCFLGHRIIEAIYRGNTPLFPIQNRQGEHNLDFYLNRGDKLFILGNIFTVLSVLGISFFVRIFVTERRNLFVILKREITKLRKVINENRKTILLLIGLSFGFYCLYFLLGMLLIPGYGYNKFTFFFADQGDWIELEWSKYHKGSHALRLLILAPFSLLKLLSPPIPKIVIAIIINSFFGALGVFLASICFWNITRNYLYTFLWSCLFGFSMTQLFFSTLIESRVLGTDSIIATYILFIICLKHQKLYLGYWIIAGLLSFGVTITNLSHTLICFAILVFGLNIKNKLVSIPEYLGGIMLIAFPLSIIQKKLFDGKYFFLPDDIAGDLEWINVTILKDPFLGLQELLKHFFLVNFVSPSPFPQEIIPGTKIILDFFDRPLVYSAIGLIATILWLFFLGVGVYKNISSLAKGNNRYFFIALLLVTISNLIFYSIFDAPEMFIFTPYFSFPIILLAVNQSMMKKRYFMVLTSLFVICMGINNLIIIGQIISLARS